MNLKKINPNLQQALIESGLIEPVDVQRDTFSSLKSGADCVIVSPPGSGKTTTIVINIIQKLQKPEGESTRALVIVDSKEKMLEMEALFAAYGKHNGLRVHGTNDKSDIDNDKNLISLGIDVLIGTPNKINALFSGAGFNMNTIKMLVVDDADVVFRNRHDAIVQRLSDSVAKTQRVFTATEITEKLDLMADKIMVEPVWFEEADDE
ncbi:Cold-shock DEAD box protein A [Flavobacterium longum]|uniref:DEAD/DEAH box helicase n=1 Tax=Flavobacterium longum TaxID=1299340 RepID=UPI0039EA1DE1